MSEEFLTHLCDQVEGLQKRWGLAEGPAFLMWYATEALDLTEDVAYEAVSYDGGNDKDVDLFHLDEQHERILIAQGKFNRKGGYKANKNELLGLLHTTDWLGNREALVREGRQELVSRRPMTTWRGYHVATASSINTCMQVLLTKTPWIRLSSSMHEPSMNTRVAMLP